MVQLVPAKNTYGVCGQGEREREREREKERVRERYCGV